MMLLRSSSSPVIGSLLASFSAESPLGNNNNNHFEPKPNSIHTTPNKFSFHPPSPFNISHTSSSPISPSIDLSSGFIRRSQSDGNLEALSYNAEKKEYDSLYCDLYHHDKIRSRGVVLETIKSFSTYDSGALDEEEGDSDREYDEEDVEDVEESVWNVGLDEKVKKVSLSEDMRTVHKMWGGSFEEERGEVVSQEMYLAKGIGIGGGSGGGRGGREASWESGGGDGGDNNKNVEEHYKQMVDEHPGNPLFLGNYANFLYQNKRDLPLAEEYYSRSILADPNDGEILAQYAKVVWELHRDEDRALCYYERAVQAAPQDSHVHAAYASFLWETEDDDEDDDADQQQGLGTMSPYIHGGMIASASAY